MAAGQRGSASGSDPVRVNYEQVHIAPIRTGTDSSVSRGGLFITAAETPAHRKDVTDGQ